MLMSYNTSMFGAKEIAGTHGRLIVGSSLAAFGGPFILGRLRDRASESAMLDLTKKIDPEVLSSEYVVFDFKSLISLLLRIQESMSRNDTKTTKLALGTQVRLDLKSHEFDRKQSVDDTSTHATGTIGNDRSYTVHIRHFALCSRNGIRNWFCESNDGRYESE